MDSYFFKKTIIKKMAYIKAKYSLLESFENEIIKYYHSKFTLIFSMENYFDVEICVVLNTHKDSVVYLTSILEYLNSPSEIINIIHKNQHSSEKTFEKWIDDVIPIICDVVDKLSIESDIFVNYFSFARERQKNLLENDYIQKIKRNLNEKWNNQDYIGFLGIYNKYENLFINDKILQKKSIYSKKKISIRKTD